jgi:hypothetical protein
MFSLSDGMANTRPASLGLGHFTARDCSLLNFLRATENFSVLASIVLTKKDSAPKRTFPTANEYDSRTQLFLPILFLQLMCVQPNLSRPRIAQIIPSYQCPLREKKSSSPPLTVQEASFSMLRRFIPENVPFTELVAHYFGPRVLAFTLASGNCCSRRVCVWFALQIGFQRFRRLF